MKLKTFKVSTGRPSIHKRALGGAKRPRPEGESLDASAVSHAPGPASTQTAHAAEAPAPSAAPPAEESKAAKRAKRLARLKALKSKGAFADKGTAPVVALAAPGQRPRDAPAAPTTAPGFGDDDDDEASESAAKARAGSLLSWAQEEEGGDGAPAPAPKPATPPSAAASDELEAYMAGIRAEAGVDLGGPGIAGGTAVTLEDIMAQEGGDAGGSGGDEGGVDAAAFTAALKAGLAGEDASSPAPAPARARAVEVLEGDDDLMDDAEVMASTSSKSALELLREKMAKKDLKPVDHAAMDYPAFRKAFYIEAPDVAAQTAEEVAQARKGMEMAVRGRDVPKPIFEWEHAGLSARVMQALEAGGFPTPFAIQRQALPAIMSGRDVIGIAKTGSGKTLAYLLPMLRHILDQPPVADAEGPVGLIMVPARELAMQVYSAAKRFCKALGMSIVPVYGGASVAEQIAGLKRGCHIVVCTPGRLIDILTMNSGRTLSLARVTYLVLDEADRMFDMGFEPQVARIVRNTRPDRQTVMFSATFPSHVESLAKKVLGAPIEIVVGGRSVSSGDIDQHVEMVTEGGKFKRLLKWMGQYFDKGCVLVFVDTQERCDGLFAKLLGAGYPSLSLHGGKDQFDRDSSIADFKNKVRRVMVATSVAGRGLDVKDLVLVVNYSCPNHMEDYVHRIGRTGRAGKKGTAVTFITPDDAQYAPDIARALRQSKQEVPPALADMAAKHTKAVKAGEARKRRSGYATKGHRFDGTELNETQWLDLLQRLRAGVAAGTVHPAELDESEAEYKAWRDKQAPADRVHANAAAGGGGEGGAVAASVQPARVVDKTAVALAKAKLAAITKAASVGKATQEDVSSAKAALDVAEKGVVEVKVDEAAAQAARAAAAGVAATIQSSLGLTAASGIGQKAAFSADLEINDYPQKARFRIQKSETLRYIYEHTGCGVTKRGMFFAPGRRPGPGEEKLSLHIEGDSEKSVMAAKYELRRILEETTMSVTYDADEYARMMMS